MIYRMNMSRDLLWISVTVATAIAIAMIVAWSIGLIDANALALPQPQSQVQVQVQGNTTALADKGLRLALEGNYSGALDYYHKVLAIDPNDTYTLSSIGKVFYHLHNYRGAIAFFDKALALLLLNL